MSDGNDVRCFYKIFSTFGSLWGSDYTQNSNDYEIRSSVGISFDILTRLAPLSFSYAVPLQKESEDKVREFNFIPWNFLSIYSSKASIIGTSSLDLSWSFLFSPTIW